MQLLLGQSQAEHVCYNQRNIILLNRTVKILFMFEQIKKKKIYFCLTKYDCK